MDEFFYDVLTIMDMDVLGNTLYFVVALCDFAVMIFHP